MNTAHGTDVNADGLRQSILMIEELAVTDRDRVVALLLDYERFLEFRNCFPDVPSQDISIAVTNRLYHSEGVASSQMTFGGDTFISRSPVCDLKLGDAAGVDLTINSGPGTGVGVNGDFHNAADGLPWELTVGECISLGAGEPIEVVFKYDWKAAADQPVTPSDILAAAANKTFTDGKKKASPFLFGAKVKLKAQVKRLCGTFPAGSVFNISKVSGNYADIVNGSILLDEVPLSKLEVTT